MDGLSARRGRCRIPDANGGAHPRQKEHRARRPSTSRRDRQHALLPRRADRTLGIHEVSLYVGWDGDLRPESEYTDLDAFYERLRDSPQVPTTSQPSVGDFMAGATQPLVAAGQDVISVHIASGLSGTCESAREAVRLLAEEGHPGRVEVVDGRREPAGSGCR